MLQSPKTNKRLRLWVNLMRDFNHSFAAITRIKRYSQTTMDYGSIEAAEPALQTGTYIQLVNLKEPLKWVFQGEL